MNTRTRGRENNNPMLQLEEIYKIIDDEISRLNWP